MKYGSVDAPDFDDDPAVLSAMFGGYEPMAAVWRKVILASAREIVRSSAAISGTRLSEARIDDLARVSSEYLTWLERSLRARIAYERNVKDSGGVGR